MTIKTKKPLFISFEGCDGCGKTTQMALLCEYLDKHKVKYVRTKEPGGCPSAMKLRKLLVEGEDDAWDDVSELLLFSAARHEHLRKNIRPNLASGRWVITDRFADSSTAFQSYGRGLDIQTVMQVHNIAIDDTWPDFTIILDVPAVEAHGRATKVSSSEQRFESLGSEFQQRVRDGFQHIASANQQRCKLIDATGTIEQVHERIVQALEDFLDNLKKK